MNREMKFKAVKNGKIIGQVAVWNIGNLVSVVGDATNFFIADELLQYTGLTDKKGVELYENDIVRVLGGEEHQGYRELDIIGIIIFSSCSFNIKDKNNIHYSFDYTPIDEIEKIGNIYQQ